MTTSFDHFQAGVRFDSLLKIRWLGQTKGLDTSRREEGDARGAQAAAAPPSSSPRASLMLWRHISSTANLSCEERILGANSIHQSARPQSTQSLAPPAPGAVSPARHTGQVGLLFGSHCASPKSRRRLLGRGLWTRLAFQVVQERNESKVHTRLRWTTAIRQNEAKSRATR
jgi:hypothetical protein